MHRTHIFIWVHSLQFRKCVLDESGTFVYLLDKLHTQYTRCLYTAYTSILPSWYIYAQTINGSAAANSVFSLFFVAAERYWARGGTAQYLLNEIIGWKTICFSIYTFSYCICVSTNRRFIDWKEIRDYNIYKYVFILWKSNEIENISMSTTCSFERRPPRKQQILDISIAAHGLLDMCGWAHTYVQHMSIVDFHLLFIKRLCIDITQCKGNEGL